jgi:hypothetical protein
LPFDEWKKRHFDPAKAGGRPGRPGGPAQVSARKLLEDEGFRNVENVKLGDNFVDMVKANSLGGTDYVEVGKMLQDGQPVAREALKIGKEIAALGPSDRLIFVDEYDISRRIYYTPGDSVD